MSKQFALARQMGEWYRFEVLLMTFWWSFGKLTTSREIVLRELEKGLTIPGWS